MGNKHLQLIEELRKVITEKLSTKLDNRYLFHDYQHTASVVAAASKISCFVDLSGLERTVLMVSSWFHDIGYLYGHENHEEIGANYAEYYLRNKHCTTNFIQSVRDTILATRLGATPKNLVECTIKDADLYHLSQSYFFTVSEKLRVETSNLRGESINRNEWTEADVKFLSQHKYFTHYGKEQLNVGKIRNLKRLGVDCELISS